MIKCWSISANTCRYNKFFNFAASLINDDLKAKILQNWQVLNGLMKIAYLEVLSQLSQQSGTIYVLRSLSENPVIKEHQELLHKIGVTGSDIERRIANARNDATYMLADVEIVATYKLSNINRVKLENLLHRFFDPARLTIEIKDRFGKPVLPREWFLVPLRVIDEVVQLIREGRLGDYWYDREQARIIEK